MKLWTSEPRTKPYEHVRLLISKGVSFIVIAAKHAE
jgi:hypothetical protein